MSINVHVYLWKCIFIVGSTFFYIIVTIVYFYRLFRYYGYY
jgi:hypothetical protein